MCVIQEYRYYTMCLSQYHWCSQYHKSISIPWVFVKTMNPCTISPCLYHESMSILWVHVYTISPCVYHESMSIPWVHVYTMSLCLYHKSVSMSWVHVYNMSPCKIHASMSIPLDIQFSEIKKNTNNRNKGILIAELQKYIYI